MRRGTPQLALLVAFLALAAHGVRPPNNELNAEDPDDEDGGHTLIRRSSGRTLGLGGHDSEEEEEGDDSDELDEEGPAGPADFGGAVKGGPYMSACEQITKALEKGEACNRDEFMMKAWMIAVEVDCQLNKAQNVLELLAKKFQLAAKAAFPYWLHKQDMEYGHLAKVSARDKAKWRADLTRAEQRLPKVQLAIEEANDALVDTSRQKWRLLMANTTDLKERARLRARKHQAEAMLAQAMSNHRKVSQEINFWRKECRRTAKKHEDEITGIRGPVEVRDASSAGSMPFGHQNLGNPGDFGKLGVPALCELNSCISSISGSCRRCTGQLHFTTPDKRLLLMMPQPYDGGTVDAYSYNGTEVRVLTSSAEVMYVDPYKINKGLWYATVLGSQEDLKELYAYYFSEGVQSRLRYRGYDPAIIMDLLPDAEATGESLCVGRPNKNLIDPGNSHEFFRGSVSRSVRRNASRAMPYWQAPGKFLVVASKATMDESNKPMGTVTMDVNMSALAKRLLDKLTITASAYTVIVNDTGHIIVLSKSAKETLFNKETTEDDISRTIGQPRCQRGMTHEQLKNCLWESTDKVLTLADIADAKRYSGANFSGVLAQMFKEGKSNCSLGMQQADVCFPTKSADGECQLHLVSFCAFSAVPEWGLILGSRYPDVTEAARLSVSALDTSNENLTISTHEHKIHVRVKRQALLEDLEAGLGMEDEVLHFKISNTGRIPLPYEVLIPDTTQNKALHTLEKGIVQLTSASHGRLSRQESALLNFNLAFRNATFGNHTETIIIRANDEEPRGTCFRKATVINLQVELLRVRRYTMVRKFLRDHGVEVMWALGILSVLVCSMPLALYARHTIRKQAKQESTQRLKLDSALDSTSRVAFPMVLMAAKEFKRMGALVCHEQMMRLHADIWLYSVEEVKEFSKLNHIIFVSHQWTGFENPDPSGVQYRAMVMSIDTLAMQENWDEELMYIWVDYFSIPQTHRGTQHLAINSLTVYASNVMAFVVVAPPVKHKELCEVCDKATYQRRAWCRAEQLAHLLALGNTRMYLAEDDVLIPLRDIEHWLQQSQYVFQGDLTCCRRKHVGMEKCDKELLVVPMLGLWAELYQKHLEDRLSADQQDVYNSISAHLDEVFPRTFEFVNQKGGIEIRPLFGDLTDRLLAAMEERHKP